MENTARVITSLFSSCWQLFSLPVPGFPFTYAQMMIGFFVIGLSIFVFKHFFDLGGSSAAGYRSGSSRKVKVSKERKNDQL